MYLTIILLPLIGSLAAGLRGRAIGSTGAQLIATICLISTTFLALIAFYEVALCRSPVTVNLGNWIVLGTIEVSWTASFDDLTVSMLLPVLCVSSAVHVYSMSYMADDPHTPRFFSYLSLFTGSMVVLVTGDSYLVLFVGWEIIGVASYLLIGFWLTRVQAQTSAIKAMCVNRVGDTALSIGFFVCAWVVGSLDYSTVLGAGIYVNETVLTVIALLFLGGAMSKSAQLPLITWLADAMEGPTPVSALIHAATLVTAGVYLLLRTAPLLEQAPTALVFIAWLGAATSMYAASVGLLVNDLKRVIAFSTCSQLGYMVMAVGLSQYHVGLFHLVTHASYKACLFMGAGSVIHAIGDQQDLRRLGGLSTLLPFTYVCMLIASLSLIALPGLSGFYSKDHLLELAGGCYSLNGHVVYWAGTLAAACTAFYSTRLLLLVFFAGPRSNRATYVHVHEAPILLGAPIAVLSLLAIGFGYCCKDLWLGMGTDFLSATMPVNPMHIVLMEAEFALPAITKLLPLIVTLSGTIAAVVLYLYYPFTLYSYKITWIGRIIYGFINGQWRWNALVTRGVIMPALTLGFYASKVLDRGLIETVGPYGLSQSIAAAGRDIASYDTSIVTSYALYIVIGFVGIAIVLLAPSVHVVSILVFGAGLWVVLFFLI